MGNPYNVIYNAGVVNFSGPEQQWSLYTSDGLDFVHFLFISWNTLTAK